MFNSNVKVAFIVFILTTSLMAQIIDFDLSEYATPEFKRHSMSTSFDLTGNNSFNDYEFDSDDMNYIFKTDDNSFRFGADGEYSYRNHSKTMQRGLTGSLNTYYTYGSSTNETDQPVIPGYRESENTFTNTYFDLNGYIRYYLNSSNIFFETNLDVQPDYFLEENNYSTRSSYGFIDSDADTSPLDYYEEERSFSSSSDEKNTYAGTSIDLETEILAGLGRIDDVSDARLSVYIYQDLLDRNCLSKQPEKQDIIALAELITAIRNESIFDSREKKISDITKIDEFLKNRGLIKENGAPYFTSLYDNWEYASQSRESGYRFSFGIVPGYKYSDQLTVKDEYYESRDYDSSVHYVDNIPVQTDITTTLTERTDKLELDDDDSEFSLSGLIRFEHERPFNLYWQGSLSAKMSYGRTFYDYDTDHPHDELEVITVITSDGESTDTLTTTEHSGGNAYSDDKYEYDRFNTEFSYRLGYYPNTRTDMGITATALYSFTDYEYDESKRDIKRHDLAFSATYDANYYISPKLRLSGTLSGRYSIYSIEQDYYIEAVDYEGNILETYEGKNEEYRSGLDLAYRLSLNYYIF